MLFNLFFLQTINFWVLPIKVRPRLHGYGQIFEREKTFTDSPFVYKRPAQPCKFFYLIRNRSKFLTRTVPIFRELV